MTFGKLFGILKINWGRLKRTSHIFGFFVFSRPPTLHPFLSHFCIYFSIRCDKLLTPIPHPKRDAIFGRCLFNFIDTTIEILAFLKFHENENQTTSVLKNG